MILLVHYWVFLELTSSKRKSRKEKKISLALLSQI